VTEQHLPENLRVHTMIRKGCDLVPCDCPTCVLIHAAADRIEELEAALHRVSTMPGPTYPLLPADTDTPEDAS
jgi:hypothetical protein